MEVTVGIFEKEVDVLEGIRLLREAGVDQGEIRIVVNNREGVPILTSNVDVPIDELYAIQEARRDGDEGDLYLGAVPFAMGYPVGNTVTNTGAIGAVVAGFDSDGPSIEEVLNDIGISGIAAELCEKAVETGRYLLVADSDLDINVQSLLHLAGAVNIVNPL
jgi:hypothetical protein